MSSNQAQFLSLAAGPEQLPAIRTAQRNGWRVVAFDRNPEAPGLREADISYSFDALSNLQRVEAIARAASVQALLPVPLGAMLQAAGELNDRLGLPGISSASALFSTDKLLQRTLLQQSGLPQPQSIPCDSAIEIRQAAKMIAGPGVLKPRFGSGSAGVFLFEGPEGVESHLHWHLKSIGQCAPGSGPRSLVERCVDGFEFGVDAVITGTEFLMLAVRQKDMTPFPFRLSRGLYSPPQISEELLAKIELTCRRAASAACFTDCMMHFDVIASEDTEPTIIETSGRPSGFHISALMLPAILGYSPIEQLMRRLLGLSFDFTPQQSHAAVLQMLESPPGVVVEVKGIRDALHSHGVLAAESFLKPGDMIQRQDSGSTGFKVGYILTAAPTLAEAKQQWIEAAKRVSFSLA